MTDLLADYREWRAAQAERIGTHSDRCHLWHDRCFIHRLAREVERLRAACGTTQENASDPSEERARISYR